ncbi:MAG: TraR/DksA C4-type zinc finger protein [Bdellovibrionaceae bacterium]|nr:TraR/DksA C4-type zinc finger protein [Pseudobdellovibrionaceae bacterium]
MNSTDPKKSTRPVVELSENDIQMTKDSLLMQKSLILNKTHEFKQDHSAPVQISDEAEAVSHNIFSMISIHLHERDRLALIQIEKALGRIANRTYGQCESCGDSISARRLAARPLTTFCIACMEEKEEARNLTAH